MAVSVARAGRRPPEPRRDRPRCGRWPSATPSITGGFWAERLRRNRERTIPHGFAQLDRAGNFHDLRLAAGASGSYQALGLMFGAPFPFLDSDVYKWLEAAGWELGRAESDELRAQADLAIELVAKAQRPDGYLNTFVQVLAPGTEYRDLKWGHELYCVGHLIQAAVAWKRAARRRPAPRDRVARRGTRRGAPSDRAGARRSTVTPRSRWPSSSCTGRRASGATSRPRPRSSTGAGTGCSGSDRFGAAYWQDHATVRDAPTVAGHAVRQLYLDCGAVDVATELGDDGAARRGRDAAGTTCVATRMYLTGGVGSRHRDESFGDPYELPPDQAYTETCAAIASVMLAWRLLLATGDPRAADLIERTILNGVLSGLGPGRDLVLLRQPAPAADRPGGRRSARGRAADLVSLRLLPAEPDADPRVVGAAPRDDRRRRRPGPAVRRRDDPRRRRGRRGPAGHRGPPGRGTAASWSRSSRRRTRRGR